MASHGEQVDVGSKSRSAVGRLPRFTVRTLLLVTGLVAVVLAIWQAVGPTMGLTLLLLFTAISLHVVGNALGTRLRDQGTRRPDRATVDDPPPHGACPRRSPELLAAHQFAPVTGLSQHASLGWWPVIVTALAGLGGAAAGGHAWRRLYPEAANWSALAVGGLATGALAAMFAYWMASWLQVCLGAWWQAHREGHRRH